MSLTTLILAGALMAIVAGILLWYWATPIALWFRFLERRHGRMHSGWLSIQRRALHVLYRPPDGIHQPQTVLLLHGLGGDSDHWCLLSAELPKHLQLIAPDLPGFGASQAPECDISGTKQAAAWLAALLQELNIPACHVIGNSMGGYLAAQLAHDYPDKVLSLWLLAPGGLRDVPHSDVMNEVAADQPNPLVVTSLTQQKRLFQLTMHRWLWLPEAMHRWLARRARRQAKHCQACFDAMRYHSPQLESLAPEINQPVLLTWGENDRVLHPDGVKVLQQLTPNIETQVLERTGHLPMLERPRLCANRYTEFLNSLNNQ